MLQKVVTLGAGLYLMGFALYDLQSLFSEGQHKRIRQGWTWAVDALARGQIFDLVRDGRLLGRRRGLLVGLNALRAAGKPRITLRRAAPALNMSLGGSHDSFDVQSQGETTPANPQDWSGQLNADLTTRPSCKSTSMLRFTEAPVAVRRAASNNRHSVPSRPLRRHIGFPKVAITLSRDRPTLGSTGSGATVIAQHCSVEKVSAARKRRSPMVASCF